VDIFEQNKVLSYSSCVEQPCVIEQKDNVYTVVCRNDSDFGSNWDTPIKSGELAINVRHVDLANLFPNSSNGSARANWLSEKGMVVKGEIESEGYAIYSKNPQYSFILTNEKIRQIREKNIEKKDYFDFNMKCDENGLHCESKFLDEMFPGNSSVRQAREGIWK